MSAPDAARTMARLGSALVSDRDGAAVLADVAGHTPDVFGADAAAVVVEHAGDLELLVASSHAAGDLELHQAQLREGPCVDAWRSGEPVQLSGADALARRWPNLGPTLARLDFSSVLAVPLRLPTGAFGALGLFWHDETVLDAALRPVAQGLADLIGLTVAAMTTPDDARLRERVDALLTGRVVVEQAKGAVAHVHGIDLAAAYMLLERATASGRGLADVAADALAEARRAR